MTIEKFKENNPQYAHLEGDALWDTMQNMLLKSNNVLYADPNQEKTYHKPIDTEFGKFTFEDSSTTRWLNSKGELVRVGDKNISDNYLYITCAFPYPSGNGLHIGHHYNYSIIDSYCRYKRYLGVDVFQPFGFDSFGLPAENYAKQVGRSPKEVTYENIEKFRLQMKQMNTEYEELLITSDESYKKQTQWLFTKLLENNLAYKKNGEVDYCNSCETTLAREQVKEGKCDRCNSVVIKKTLNQWYF